METLWKKIGSRSPKGSRQKITEEVVRTAAEAGETPLEYMLRIMRERAANILFPTFQKSWDSAIKHK